MGYAHYYTASRPLTDAEWVVVRTDFYAVVERVRASGIALTVDEEPGRLCLNGGEEDEQHEDFLLEQAPPNRGGTPGFSFCKTAAKPYDVAVTAILSLLKHTAPDAYDIGSDGGPEDWEEGLELARAIEPSVVWPVLAEEGR